MRRANTKPGTNLEDSPNRCRVSPAQPKGTEVPLSDPVTCFATRSCEVETMVIGDPTNIEVAPWQFSRPTPCEMSQVLP